MSEGRVRVLLVEDDEDDYVIARGLLEEIDPHRYELEWASSFDAGLAAAARDEHDVCLFDYRLGARTGVELIPEVRKAGYAGPIILLTGQTSVETDVEAMRAGATDYLVKGQVDARGLDRAIRYAVERRRLQAQLVVADRLTSVGTLAAGVAHEVNNPIMAIRANVDAAIARLPELVDEDLAAGRELAALDVGAALEEARAAANRVAEIVAGLDTFSRASEEGVRSIALPQVVEAALGVVANQLHHKARVVRAVDDDLPTVRGNEARLAQALVNVLVNAGQAIPDAPRRGDEHRVELSVSPAGEGTVRIAISDTGVGIPAEIRGRIFDPFFTTRGPRGGAGLGLAIAQSTVESMGGTIGVASLVGAGTTVEIVLPAESRRSPTAPPPSTAGALDPATNPLRILIVDDDALVSRAVSRLCHGHDVARVEGGAEALRHLVVERADYDVILCDLMMPQVGGAEVYRRLESGRPDLARRIVFMTGGAFTEAARAFLDAVPNPRLHKPFDRVALAEAIGRLGS